MDDELLQDLEKLGEEEGGVDGEGRTDALSLYNHGVDLLSNAELVGDIDSIAKILHSGSCKSTLAVSIFIIFVFKRVYSAITGAFVLDSDYYQRKSMDISVIMEM